MKVLKDLRLRCVVADHDEGERQRCNESEKMKIWAEASYVLG